MAPINIGTRRELFADDFLIEKMKGAALRLGHPERRDVALVGDAPWEDGTLGALSLVEEGELVRLYYRAAIPDLKDERNQIIAMAVSRDGGRRFERPDLGLVEFNGSRKNNILWRGGMPGVPPAFIDGHPACPPDARYKGLVQEWGKLYAMASADGLRWRLMQEAPLRMDGSFDTINTAFWDALTGCYRSYTRMFVDPATGRPYPHDGVNWSIAVRAIQTSTSPDFINWTLVQPLIYRDDSLDMQMYTNAVLPCPGAEHIYIGFPNRIRTDRVKFPGQRWPGVNDGLFMCSRDGLTWTRYREAWVRPGLDPRNWTHRNNYPTWGMIRGNDEEWSMLVSGHYMQPDGAPCVMHRLAIRPWGFVSVSAGFGGGEMTTKPLTFEGRQLRINYSTSAGGSLQVEIRDENGKPFKGYSRRDMAPLFGDEIDAIVSWKRGSDLSALIGRPVRFRFILQDADLYALRTV